MSRGFRIPIPTCKGLLLKAWGYSFSLSFLFFFPRVCVLNYPNSFFFVWSHRQEIRASTSSMTSVPKPLKFLRPHYGTLKAFHQTMPDSDLKVCHLHFTFFLGMAWRSLFFSFCVFQKYLSDILSVLALTMSAEGERVCLYLLNRLTKTCFPTLIVPSLYASGFLFFYIFDAYTHHFVLQYFPGELKL